mgnify:CR=1 FL=1
MGILSEMPHSKITSGIEKLEHRGAGSGHWQRLLVDETYAAQVTGGFLGNSMDVASHLEYLGEYTAPALTKELSFEQAFGHCSRGSNFDAWFGKCQILPVGEVKLSRHRLNWRSRDFRILAALLEDKEETSLSTLAAMIEA